MEEQNWEKFFTFCLIIMILLTGVSFIPCYYPFFADSQPAQILTNQVFGDKEKVAEIPENVRSQKLANPPAIIKSVYVTGYSAGTRSYINYLDTLFKDTQINAVVIDVKDSSGHVSYDSDAPEVKKYKLSSHAISDVDSLVKFFHGKNIYVIGRIAVFEDPVYSKVRPELAIYNKAKTTDLSHPVLWQDSQRLSWLDPASKDVWDYNVSLAKDALSHGFDEINFDYIRFPSDGNVANMGFPVFDKTNGIMRETIKNFFQYLREQMPQEKLSVDLFGQTTTNKDDMGIGQQIEDAFLYFDYICPMVYPSHYINGFIGFANPAAHPYEVVRYSLDGGLQREVAFASQSEASAVKAKFRPWLQDFNMGAYYTSDMVKAEIKATEDSLGKDFVGFMLWNPLNRYNKGAVLTPN